MLVVDSVLKGNQTKEASQTLSLAVKCKMHTRKFFTEFLILFGVVFVFSKSKFEICKSTTVSASIFYPAFCISDVINRVRVCEKIISYVMNHPFSSLHW